MAAPKHRAARRRGPRWARAALAASQLSAVAVLGAGTLALALPAAFGWQTLVVRDLAMGATAPVGSVVLAEPVPEAKVGVGDVVIMKQPTSGELLTRRIVSVASQDDRLIVRAKGDANPTPDPVFYQLPQTVSRSVLAVPHLGYAVGFLQTPPGRWVMVGLAGLLMLSAVIRPARRGRRTT